MSLVHILFFVAMLITLETAATDAAATAVLVLAAVLAADLSVYCLLGATPLSLIGVVVTSFVWNVRGNAVPCIPYKVVFIVYIVTLVGMLRTCGRRF